MTISPVELGRLAIMQRAPLHFVERRVEHLDLPDDYHYGVRVIQQFVAPYHGEQSKTASERELLVPLGQFSKDRMPDLRTLGPDGSILPLLSRSDRGAVGAALFAARWANLFFDELSDATQKNAKKIWDLVGLSVAEVVIGSKRQSEVAIFRLERTLDRWSRAPKFVPELRQSVLALLSTEQFWIDIYALAETRLLVARLQGVPGRTYAVTVEYTERFHYRGYAKSSISGLVRKGLAWLGLISLPIARSVANLGQATSLWIVQSIPEGVEPLRYYWKRERNSTRPTDPVSVDITRAVAAKHQKPGEQPEKDLLLLDVQISPSTAMVATIGLALLLLVVATYVYQALPEITTRTPSGDHHLFASLRRISTAQTPDEDRTILVGLGSIFAAVPAGIAGALAYGGQTFVRRASRGPRTLLAILSVQAAFFAVVVSLKNLGGLAETTAYVLSIYSLVVIGVFLFIQFGPRWRKNERSRKKSATMPASPIDCHKKQVRDALIWLAFWTILVLVFARSQAVLQEKHFFSGEFPDNVWRAWWSWF